MRNIWISTLLILLLLLLSPSVEAKSTTYNNLSIYDWRGHTNIGYMGVRSDNISLNIESSPTSISIKPFSYPIQLECQELSGGNYTWTSPLKLFPVYPYGTYSNGWGVASVFSLNNSIKSPSSPYISVPDKCFKFDGHVFSNLTPNTIYTISCFTEDWWSPGSGYGIFIVPLGTSYQDSFRVNITTEAARPILSASNIKDKKVTINWNPNGNPSGTSYTLQRRLNASQSWADVYTGTANSYTNENLTTETTYQYRIRVNHIAGADWYTYSYQNGAEHIEITTTADPAVAAAQEASSKAQAAKEAAEQTLQYSLDAKQAAQDTFGQVTNPGYGLSAIKSEILNIKSAIDANMQAPIINYIKGENNATATLGSDIVIDTSVSNATHYRIKGEDWNTYVNNQITVTGVNKGLNKIEIEFGNFIIKEEGLVGNTCKGIVNIFGL